MNISVFNFAKDAADFFSTSPKEKAYKDIFPKDHMLSLFFKRQEFRKKLLEKNEDVEKRKDKQMHRIKEVLHVLSQSPQETPPVSPEAENILSEYATLIEKKDSGESVDESKASLDQRFITFIGEQSIPPFSSLITEGAKFLSKKAGSGVTANALSLASTATGPVGKISTFLASKFGPQVLSWTKRNLKYVFAGIGGAAGLLVGGMGGAVAGGIGGLILGSGLGGGLAGVEGAFTSVIGGAQTFITGVTGATLSAVIPPIIIAAVSIPSAIAIILFIINSGAYVVPPAQEIGALGSIDAELLAGRIESPYIDVEKVAVPKGPFQNSDLPKKITYKITVRAKKGGLTNIRFENTCKVLQKSRSNSARTATCNPPVPEDSSKPAVIDPGTTYEFTYDQEYTSPLFEDTAVVDIFKVTADALPEKKDAVAAAVASVVFGNPPSACPGGWPVDTTAGQTYRVSQGPGGSATHGPPNYAYEEAIDINPLVKPSGTHLYIVASHAGIAYPNVDQYGGLDIFLKDTCGGNFASVYVHNSVILVKSGQQVQAGQVIAIMGSTGFASATHLHYSFREQNNVYKTRQHTPPFMIVPYIPKTVPIGCVGYDSCKTSIP